MRIVVFALFVATALSSRTSNMTLVKTFVKTELINDKKSDTTIKKKLARMFESWKKDMIVKGEFWSKDSCKPYIAMSGRYDDLPNPICGFPDDADFKFSYADLNGDRKLDQLVVFKPSQCDGGNGAMWSQTQVLTLSSKNQYKTSDSNRGDIFPLADENDAGFVLYDSIAPDKVYGTYYKFLDDDGHCCPSIIKQAVFDYTTKRWHFSQKKNRDDN